jgi:hypothetical protein
MELFKLKRKGGAYWLGRPKEMIKYLQHIDDVENTFGCKLILIWNYSI